MTKLEYAKYHSDSCAKMSAITAAKNSDYCGDGDDPFANFSRVEAMGITDTLRGFLVRMSDKLSRLTSFAQKGHYNVSDESFEDTCLDLANYAILLAAYQHSKRKPIVSTDGEDMSYKGTVQTYGGTVVPAPDARASTLMNEHEEAIRAFNNKGAK